MAQVKFTSALKRFFPDLDSDHIQQSTVLDVINDLEIKFPGLKNYLLDDQEELRKHVNIFMDGVILQDRKNLEIPVDEKTELYFIQALSGG